MDGDGDGDPSTAQVDFTSRSFSPREYLLRVLSKDHYTKFEKELVASVKSEASATGEELKQLVSDHLGTFIQSRETLQAVYDSDRALFTGDALTGLIESFRRATAHGENLSRPSVEAFAALRESQLNQEALEKMLSVWSTPGAMYASCATPVAVPIQASSLPNHVNVEATSPRDGAARSPATSSLASGTVDEEEETEEDEEEGDSENDEPHAKMSGRVHGALESSAAGPSMLRLGKFYALKPDEKLLLWCDVPLVVLRDVGAQRTRVATRANYEAGVVQLRRAMLYLEEHYDLLDGSATGNAEEEEVEASPPPPASEASSISKPRNQPHRSRWSATASHCTLAYGFALSLLRASLYLCHRISEQISSLHARDTVGLEDSLSMMMDVSINTLQLRHFCLALQSKLRTIRVEQPSSVPYLRPRPTTSSSITHGTPPEVLHPAQFYLRLVCNQHRRLLLKSASDVSQEARRWTAVNHAARGEKEEEEGGATRGSHDKRWTTTGPDLHKDTVGESAVGALGALTDSFSGLPFTFEPTRTDPMAPSSPTHPQPHPDDGAAEEALLQRVMEAFSTPDPTGTIITCSLDGLDLTEVVASSCSQAVEHAKSLLQQLLEGTQAESSIMSRTAAQTTFAVQLAEGCMAALETTVVTYWGGIAATIHAGGYDFSPAPGSSLERMVREATAAMKKDATVANAGRGRSGVVEESEEVPPLRFFPALGTVDRSGPCGRSLREMSVDGVRRMIHYTASLIQPLMAAFTNRSLFDSLVASLRECTTEDLTDAHSSERVELFAATLVEVLLGQFEQMMNIISSSVLRLKTTIGESCSTLSQNGEGELDDVRHLLEDLEQLRTSCLRTYFRGVSSVSKAYITSLPSIQTPSIVPLEFSVRPRLSRDYASSELSNKFVNLLSVVVDRITPFMRRSIEVFNSADLFSAKAVGSGRTPGTSFSRQKTSQGGGAAAPETDAATMRVALGHSSMVLEHLAAHEEIVSSLIAELLLAFVDVQHLKCLTACGNSEADPSTLSRRVVECLADTLCLPNCIIPLVMEHLIVPGLVEVMVDLNCGCAREGAQGEAQKAERAAMLRSKRQYFVSTFITPVVEHCQLAVDTMLRFFVAIPQRLITREIRRFGFMEPALDWQRLGQQHSSSVRSYIGDCMALVAQAHETLRCLHQPVIGAFVTQRLMGHVATTMSTAITSDINAMELSDECSATFCLYGSLLIEAEALTVLRLMESVEAVVATNGTARAGEVLAEFSFAKTCLTNTVAALARVSEVIQGPSVGGDLSPAMRQSRRTALVDAAVAELSYTVDVLNAHWEEEALGGPQQQVIGHEATRTIAERLARRTEAYRHEQHHAAAQQKARLAAAVKAAASAAASVPRKKEEEEEVVVMAVVEKEVAPQGTTPPLPTHEDRSPAAVAPSAEEMPRMTSELSGVLLQQAMREPADEQQTEAKVKTKAPPPPVEPRKTVVKPAEKKVEEEDVDDTPLEVRMETNLMGEPLDGNPLTEASAPRRRTAQRRSRQAGDHRFRRAAVLE